MSRRNAARSGRSFFSALNPYGRPIDRAIEWKRGRGLRVEHLEDRRLLAVRALSGFDTNTLDRGDAVAEFASLPFEIGFFGDQYDELVVNTNGYVSLGGGIVPLGAGTPIAENIPSELVDSQRDRMLADLRLPIIAPFWSDIDTSDTATGAITYGTDMVDGREAFGVNWLDVAYDGGPSNVTNDFQLIIIDRSDIAPLAFDLEFNYDAINWETGADSRGSNGLGGASARAGFSSDAFLAIEQYELIGSGEDGAFLDTNLETGLVNASLRSLEAGRYVFEFRAGTPLNELGLAGQAIALADDVLYLGAGPHPLSLPFEEVPTNANSIDTSDADRVQPGGSLGLNLTGAGVTVAVVEANERPGNTFNAAGMSVDAMGNPLPPSPFVRITHNDFGGRASTPGAAPTTFADHATHVAGTIGGAGTTGGYAPGVALQSFAITGDYGIAAGNIAGIDISNHSYGQDVGWGSIGESQIVAANIQNFMSGDLNNDGDTQDNVDLWRFDRTAGTEDPRFGIYSDRDASIDAFLTAAGRENLLRVRSAGNERNDQFNNQIGTSQYVTYFSAGFMGGGAGWYVVPSAGNAASTAPASDGNNGTGYDSVTPGSTSKNQLTIGSIQEILSESGDLAYAAALANIATLSGFSSYGPLDDGRLAVHLVADGDSLASSGARSNTDIVNKGGTSMASPSVAGVAALVLEHYRNLAGGASSQLPTTPTSPTQRAILMHTAEDMLTIGPDYATGYGLVQGDAAVQFVGSADGSSPIPDRTDRVIQNTLDEDNPTRTFTVNMTAGQEFIATLAWNDPAGNGIAVAFPAVPGAPPALAVDAQPPVLVNDIDLTVTAPNGTVFRPWVLDPANPANAATTGTNNVDNVEQVRFDALVAGEYTVTVAIPEDSVAEGGSQDFSLMLTAAGDVLENNDTLETATVLGSQSEITIRDLSIDDDTDVDFFKVTAHQTGKQVVRIFFDHSQGDLDLEVRDMDGNTILAVDDSTDAVNLEELVIPVVGQEMYFVRVSGVEGQTNSYDLEIENFAAPAPTGIHLDPQSDTGALNNDNVTADNTPQFFIQTDVLNFVDANRNGMVDGDEIAALTAAQATAMMPGVAVEVTLINTSDPTQPPVVGFADPVIATFPTVYRFTPSALPDGTYLVTTALKVIDGQTPAVMGRSGPSTPLWMTIDTAGPAMPAPDLLAASDTGMFNNDNVTGINSPAFAGTGEANSRVTVFAQAINSAGNPTGAVQLVGSGVVGSDLTDGIDDPPGAEMGAWEITIEPVNDGTYDFFVRFEDAAGIVSANSETLRVEIDTTKPNTPLLDLRDDTGENLADEITSDNTPDVSMTTTDPAIPFRLFTDNLKFRIYDRFEDNAEILLYDSASDAAADNVSTPGDMFTSLNVLVRNLGPLADGTHNLKLEVEDRAGNISDDFLLEVFIDTLAPVASAPNLLDTSDSGMFNDDNVTNKWQPAFDGEAEINNKVYVYATRVNPATGTQVGGPILIGEGLVGSENSNDIPDDGLGRWEVTVEPLVDGVYDITVRFEDWAGNFTPLDDANENALRIVIDKLEPNTPYLDLVTDPITGDTGRNDVDDITKQNMPLVTMTSTDPNVHLAQVLFTDNLKFRIFDRYESFDGANVPEFLLYDSAQDAAEDADNTAGDMFTINTLIEEMLPQQFFALFGASNAAVLNVGGVGKLADGVHNLKLEVEDRAGNISHDFLLTMIVDTETPPVSFGLPNAVNAVDGLEASSDSGVLTAPATYADRITNDTTPALWGRAEANTVIRVYHDNDGDGVIDLATDTFLGQTVAVPYDGNDAYVDGNGDPLGFWRINSVLDLNEIPGVRDGLRQLLVTAEDVAGNPMPMNGQIADGVDALDIFIDTQGPQVSGVSVSSDRDYDLFDPKPSTDGFTPLIYSLDIDFVDFPGRLVAQMAGDPNFEYMALAENAFTRGNYLLVGDHVGIIAIDGLAASAVGNLNGAPASQRITLQFNRPLPDDRYTLTISDVITDPVGNKLDGESNADEPQENPIFPSGDKIPGGDFVARFTVDSRPEIGTFIPTTIAIDINGNFVWDPSNAQIGNDATNVDLTFTMDRPGLVPGGFATHDTVFAGRFTQQGSGVEFNSEIVAAGGVALPARLFDQLAVYGYSIETGEHRWLIDLDSDGVANVYSSQPLLANFNVAGALPISGNFDNNDANGDEIGLYYAGNWGFDFNRNYRIDAGEIVANTGLFGVPIVGDFDGNGVDDVGVFNNNQFSFAMSAGGFGNFTSFQQFQWGFSGVLERPVAADMDQDGIDDIGLWVPRNTTQPLRQTAEWYFLLSGFAPVPVQGSIAALAHPFEPVPFGNDLYAEFGDELALPIVGNFDPPVAIASTPNPLDVVELPGDFDGSGTVDQGDYALWKSSFGQTGTGLLADGDGDGRVGLSDYSLWRDNVGSSVSSTDAPALTGDYNESGTVDQADYALWKSSFGQTGSGLAADGDGDGRVSLADYTLWRNNVGATSALAISLAAEPIVADMSEPLAMPSAIAASDHYFAEASSDAVGDSSGDGAAISDTAYFTAVDDELLLLLALDSAATADGESTDGLVWPDEQQSDLEAAIGDLEDALLAQAL